MQWFLRYHVSPIIYGIIGVERGSSRGGDAQTPTPVTISIGLIAVVSGIVGDGWLAEKLELENSLVAKSGV